MHEAVHDFLLATLELANSSLQKKVKKVNSEKGIYILICMCMWNIHRIKTDQDSTWMAKVLGLRKELLLSLLKAQLFKAPLVSASPSCSPSQCPVHPSCILAASKGYPQPPSFTFYIDQSSRQFPASGHDGLLLMP